MIVGLRSRTFKVTCMALVLVAATAAALSNLVVSGQINDDPASEPIPTIEVFTSAQSIVTRVIFNGPTDVELLGGNISFAPAPARVGSPPLIHIEVLDVDGGLLEEFNAWHPLWVEGEGDNGQLETTVEESGEGRFVFGFEPDVGIVKITDMTLGVELIEIDAHLTVVAHCAANPNDMGCATVCIGDVNGDGVASPQDIASVARAIPSTPADRRWNPDADINQDSVVDVLDLHLVLTSFRNKDC